MAEIEEPTQTQSTAHQAPPEAEEVFILADEMRLDKGSTPISPEAFLHLRNGIGLFKEARLEEAEQEVVRAIDLHPTLAPIYNVFGLLKIARGAVDTLKQSVYMALTSNPEFMDEFVAEGIALLAQEKFPQAEEKFKKAIALNPDNADAHFRLGFTYISQKKYKDAIEVYEHLTQLDPQNVNAFFMLGLAYSEIREYYPCISNMQYALRLQPAFVEARLTLADAYHNQGKYIISMEELNALEEFIPEEETTYIHRGMILIEMDRFDEAIPYFEQVIALNPETREAYELLVGLYENTGDDDKGIEMATTALEHNPDNIDIQAALARMQGRQDKLKQQREK